MIRWVVGLLCALQAPAALAQDECARGEVTSGHIHLTVIATKQASAEPAALVYLTALSADRDLSFFVGYDVAPEGQITPSQFAIDTPLLAPVGDRTQPQTIRWRRDDGDWHRLPRPIFAGSDGSFGFQVAQRGPSIGTTYRTEALDEVREGGRFVVTRLSANGEELATSAVDFPNNATINALYAEARAEALAALKPCGPPLLIRPSPF